MLNVSSSLRSTMAKCNSTRTEACVAKATLATANGARAVTTATATAVTTATDVAIVGGGLAVVGTLRAGRWLARATADAARAIAEGVRERREARRFAELERLLKEFNLQVQP